MAIKKQTKELECQCKTHKGKNPLAIQNFYNSNSPMAKEGKSPFCKKCIKEMIDYSQINSIYTVLQVMDLPYIYEYWDKCISDTNRDPFGNYLRMTNSLNQFKGLKWKDSIFDSSIKNNNNDEITEKQNKVKDEEEKIIYSEDWRGTYTESDLDYLDNYYKDLTTDFKIVTRNHKDYARKIAKASLAMDRAYDDMINGVQGSDTRYKNLKDTFDQLSKSAQFAEDKRGANEVGLGCFGVTFDKVEKHMWIPKHEPIEKDDYDKLLDAFSTINKSL